MTTSTLIVPTANSDILLGYRGPVKILENWAQRDGNSGFGSIIRGFGPTVLVSTGDATAEVRVDHLQLDTRRPEAAVTLTRWAALQVGFKTQDLGCPGPLLTYREDHQSGELCWMLLVPELDLEDNLKMPAQHCFLMQGATEDDTGSEDYSVVPELDGVTSEDVALAVIVRHLQEQKS